MVFGGELPRHPEFLVTDECCFHGEFEKSSSLYLIHPADPQLMAQVHVELAQVDPEGQEKSGERGVQRKKMRNDEVSKPLTSWLGNGEFAFAGRVKSGLGLGLGHGLGG